MKQQTQVNLPPGMIALTQEQFDALVAQRLATAPKVEAKAKAKAELAITKFKVYRTKSDPNRKLLEVEYTQGASIVTSIGKLKLLVAKATEAIAFAEKSGVAQE